MRRPDTRDAARLLARALAAPGGPLPRPVRNGAFAALANRLARSPIPECRAVAAALAAAIEAGDDAAALALASTAGRRPDLRAEKIVSREYRYLWICNPKAASRSIVAALRAADPGATLIRNRTLEAVLAAHPEARDYFRFAFLRHPVDRTRSCWADKHRLALSDRDARRWFIAPWLRRQSGHGLRRVLPLAGDPVRVRRLRRPALALAAPPAARRRGPPAGVPRALRASRRRLARSSATASACRTAPCRGSTRARRAAGRRPPMPARRPSCGGATRRISGSAATAGTGTESGHEDGRRAMRERRARSGFGAGHRRRRLCRQPRRAGAPRGRLPGGRARRPVDRAARRRAR